MATVTMATTLAPPRSGRKSSSSAVIGDLRARIRALETGGAPPVSVSLPVAENGLDHLLPTRGLHEISGDTAAIGFAAMLLGRAGTARPDASLLWCQPGATGFQPQIHPQIHPWGLAPFGLDPGRLLAVYGRNDTDLLWAMEEGLRAAGIAGVAGQVAKAPPIAARRLQLAAEKAGVPCLLLRPMELHAPVASAMSRWRVTSLPSAPADGMPGLGPARWRVELQRWRKAAEGAATPAQDRIWEVEWRDETGDFTVVAGIRHRPADPETGWRKTG